MRKIFLLTTVVFCILRMNAQYAPVTFDFEKSWFNSGGTLPAEQYFTLNGQVSANAQMVEFSVYRSLKSDPLITSAWTRSFGNQAQSFALPVNYPLRGNTKYSFVIEYFIPASEFEQSAVITTLNERFGAYVDQMVEVDNRNIRLRDNYKVVMKDLNEIMEVSMRNYRSRTGFDFVGFSSIVESKVKQLEDLKLKRAFLFVGKSDGQEKVDAKSQLLNQQLEAIKLLITSEAAQYINANLLTKFERKIIEDYPTEKTMNTLPINVGYGGVYETGNLKNLSYGTAPFIGVSFPLGNKTFASQFWSNTSLSAGVMLTKITMTSDNVYSGAIYGIPLYAALGYKVLNIMRINAGLTVLQLGESNGVDLNFNSIYIRPFIGASIEINVWAGLPK